MTHKENSDEKLKGQLILRDRLAENRTTLANERTLLAYVRTSLALFAAGVSFIEFFKSTAVAVVGWALLPLGVFTIVKGLLSFRNMSRLIGEEEKTGPE